jgi:hypothetical protein
MLKRAACPGDEQAVVSFGDGCGLPGAVCTCSSSTGRGGDYEGPGTSPDRADAMVWALTELMLQKERGEPSIRRL